MPRETVRQPPELESILLRAKLSRREWVEARRLALVLGISAEALVGQAIRDLLARQGGAEGSVKT